MKKAIDAFLNKKFLTFVLIGIVAYLTNQIVYSSYLAVSSKTILYDDSFHLIANSISYVIASVVSYILNLKFTYKQKNTLKKTISSIVIYLTKYLISLGITYGLMLLINTFVLNQIAHTLLENLIPVFTTLVTLLFQFACFNVIFKEGENLNDKTKISNEKFVE